MWDGLGPDKMRDNRIGVTLRIYCIDVRPSRGDDLLIGQTGVDMVGHGNFAEVSTI